MKGELIIILIAAGVWLISTLARNINRKQAAAAPQQQRPRPSTTDIDRFLQEINRQRDRQRQKEPEVVVLAEPVQESRPKQRARPGQRPRASQPSRSRRPGELASVPQVIAVETAVPFVSLAKPTRTAAPRAPAKYEASQVTPLRQPVSAHLAELGRLLGSRHGLQMAFMLNEILGPPRARRPLSRTM